MSPRLDSCVQYVLSAGDMKHRTREVWEEIHEKAADGEVRIVALCRKSRGVRMALYECSSGSSGRSSGMLRGA